MTRINLVPVEELVNEHLLAEYYELPRIFKLAKFIPNRSKPTSYRLGSGHMRFFYDKLEFLIKRQKLIVKELKKRGYNITYDNPESLREICTKSYLYNDWTPSEEEIKISRKRLEERKKEMGYAV